MITLNIGVEKACVGSKKKNGYRVLSGYNSEQEWTTLFTNKYYLSEGCGTSLGTI